MEGFDPIQWSPLIDTTTGSAFSAVNHANSSRPGCPRNSILTEVCGIVKQSRLAPGAAPSKSSSKVDGEFHCCLCGGTFSRKHSVKAHFVKCVDRNGNPDGKSWNDHPSIGSYKPRKVIPKQQKNRAADKWQSSWYPSSSGLLPPSGFQASPNGPTPGESPTIDPGLRGTMSIDITIGDTAQASPFLEETSPSATGSTG